jgi:hypothetical protein
MCRSVRVSSLSWQTGLNRCTTKANYLSTTLYRQGSVYRHKVFITGVNINMFPIYELNNHGINSLVSFLLTLRAFSLSRTPNYSSPQ